MRRTLPLLLASLALSACTVTRRSAPVYVSLGDSITAGFQSGGLTAAGQRAAYPVLLAARLGVPFTPPAGRDPGCPPPIAAGARGTPSCQRLGTDAPSSNLAVPGAKVEDLLTASAATVPGRAKPLYRLILGEDTQVQAALKAHPSLITVWVGANNVLAATVAGHPEDATPPAQFEASYARLLNALAPSGARLVLLTAPRVSTVPALVPGPLLALAGVADRSCTFSTAHISVFTVLDPRVKKPLSCTASYALSAAGAQAADATVDAYNATIRRLAARHGALVFDVETVAGHWQRPSLNPLDRAQPFGPDFSLDGIHPSSLAHAELARALAVFLNDHGTGADTQ